MGSIAAQQVIAKGLLYSLEVVDPSCIIAGGAPRDWYLGREASDLDVFIYLRPDLSWFYLEKQLGRALPDVKFSRDDWKRKLPECYKNNPHIRAVLNFTFRGQSCQLVVMNKPTFKCVVPKFPLSICMVWYKGGKIRITEEFRRSVKYKSIVLCNELYSEGSKYVQKILDKFPEYEFYKSWDALAWEILDD